MITHSNEPAQKHAQTKDDNALVLRSIDGDNAAFATLVDRYKRIVVALIHRITLSSQDDEDLAQQAFMKAFINLANFRFHCSFSSWLMSIAINEARMWSRKRRRSREVAMVSTVTGTGTQVPLDVPDHRQDPESKCLEQEWRSLLWRELDDLPPVTRATIEVCDLGQLSVRDTAIRLGMSVAAVKSRRSRGRATLRRRLALRLSGLYLAQKA